MMGPGTNRRQRTAMVIGVLRLTLHLPHSGSLKAKRHVVRSLLTRTRQRFQVAAMEIGDRDRWQLAELGIACVSPDGRHADEVLSHVLRFVEGAAGDAWVVDVSTELVDL